MIIFNLVKDKFLKTIFQIEKIDYIIKDRNNTLI